MNRKMAEIKQDLTEQRDGVDELKVGGMIGGCGFEEKTGNGSKSDWLVVFVEEAQRTGS